MTTTQEVMTADTRHVMAHDSVRNAAEMMTRSGMNALPICDSEQRVRGMITDRDIVIKVLGAGRDPGTTTVGDIASNHVPLILVTDEVSMALQVMNTHHVRRAAVMDGHRLVGMVSHADLARVLPDPQLGELLHALSTD